MYILSKVGRGIKICTNTAISYSVPHSAQTMVLATCVAWYGRRLALTYGPGFLAQFFMSKAYLGSKTLGWWVGALIVAPTMVPSMIPYVATGTAAGCFWLTCVTCNVVARKIFFCRKSKPSPTEGEICQPSLLISPSSSFPITPRTALKVV
jgi:hypothetical protein